MEPVLAPQLLRMRVPLLVAISSLLVPLCNFAVICTLDSCPPAGLLADDGVPLHRLLPSLVRDRGRQIQCRSGTPSASKVGLDVLAPSLLAACSHSNDHLSQLGVDVSWVALRWVRSSKGLIEIEQSLIFFVHSWYMHKTGLSLSSSLRFSSRLEPRADPPPFTGRYKTLNLIFGILPFIAALLIVRLSPDSGVVTQWLSIVWLLLSGKLAPQLTSPPVHRSLSDSATQLYCKRLSLRYLSRLIVRADHLAHSHSRILTSSP